MTDISNYVGDWLKSGTNSWQKTTHKIQSINVEKTMPFAVYFNAVKKLILLADRYDHYLEQDPQLKNIQLSELQRLFSSYFKDLSPEPDLKGRIPYDTSFANPDYACSVYGSEWGQILTWCYTQYHSYLQLVVQKRYPDLARLNKLLLIFYHDVMMEKIDCKMFATLLKTAVLEEMDEQQQFNLYWRFHPWQKLYNQIISEADFSDIRYLYRYGIHLGEQDIRMAEFINAYSEKELRHLSKYIAESYANGFLRTQKDYKIKKYAMLTVSAGMERLGKMVIKELKQIGLQTIVSQPVTKGINRQYVYDHRFDMALYLNRNYLDRMLPAYEKAVEMMSGHLHLNAGPVFVQLFGEIPFNPQNKETVLKLNEEQLNLRREMNSRTTQLFYKAYPAQETSFCIIAFPSPEIGDNFEQIFADTLKINLLDSDKYAVIQQKIIDVLDEAEYVHVKGKAGNDTDIMVRLHPLPNPEKETNFENCVADVNIPVGEVFTSPLLTGTNGTLHVEDTYLRNLRYLNLRLTFTDGMLTDYSCSNFEDEQTNRKYIEENILMPHKTLPIGEFAIGTNTTAYQIAKKYDILELLPVLIIEKMGPHFAVGDTCYTREEDVPHYNFFNNKQLVAVDNEKTAKRHEDPLNAYTQVHTDITLPYEMLQSISAVKADGTRLDIIRDGLFAVAGTEELNIPLLELRKA